MIATVKADLPDWLGQLLGRWRGNSYRGYRPSMLVKLSNYTEKLFKAALHGSLCKIPSPEMCKHILPDPNG
jgi:hypothetical protein